MSSRIFRRRCFRRSEFSFRGRLRHVRIICSARPPQCSQPHRRCHRDRHRTTNSSGYLLPDRSVVTSFSRSGRVRPSAAVCLSLHTSRGAMSSRIFRRQRFRRSEFSFRGRLRHVRIICSARPPQCSQPHRRCHRDRHRTTNSSGYLLPDRSVVTSFSRSGRVRPSAAVCLSLHTSRGAMSSRIFRRQRFRRSEFSFRGRLRHVRITGAARRRLYWVFASRRRPGAPRCA